jgi:histidine ammonia-lyase
VLTGLLTTRYRAQQIVVINEGESGERVVERGEDRMETVVLTHRPDALLVLEGVNGLNSATDVDAISEALRRGVRRAIRDGVKKVFVSTLLPGAEGGAFGQDDVVSPVFPAWHKHERAALAFERALSVLAAVASQALWVTDRGAPPALAGLLERIRAEVPPVDDVAPRTLGHDCGRLAEAFRAELSASLRSGQAAE